MGQVGCNLIAATTLLCLLPQSVWLQSYLIEPTKLPASDGRRLFDDLMREYNKLVRPVKEDSMTLDVSLGIKLTQLIDVVRIHNYHCMCRVIMGVKLILPTFYEARMLFLPIVLILWSVNGEFARHTVLVTGANLQGTLKILNDF